MSIDRVRRRRFFAADAEAGRRLALSPDEARHARDVLRLATGEEVTVFDGRGREYLARAVVVGRSGVVVDVLHAVEVVEEPAVDVTLAQAVLKGDAMDSVVRDAVMLGVTTIQPLVTRFVTSSGAWPRARALDRWRKIAVASAKQCGRAVVPEVRPPIPLGALLAADTPGVRLMLVEPRARGEEEGRELRRVTGQAPPAAATVLIGSEGGWSPEEVAAARSAGYVPVTLGRRTWRADAVPVGALAILFYVWGEL